jgi:hypothetical protein
MHPHARQELHVQCIGIDGNYETNRNNQKHKKHKKQPEATRSTRKIMFSRGSGVGENA